MCLTRQPMPTHSRYRADTEWIYPMPIQSSSPAIRAHYFFILWGDRFDEDVATIFTTEARRVGLCVKIVGVNGYQSPGNHGMILTADLTLGQAMQLADKAVAVIVPCSPATLARLEDDPRVVEFFQQARTNRALLVVSHQEAVARSSLYDLPHPPSRISYYKDYPNLIDSARQLVHGLMAAVGVSG